MHKQEKLGLFPIKVRPLKESRLNLFKMWLEKWVEEWYEKTHGWSPDEMAEFIHKCAMEKLDEVLPIKERKISSDDKPFVIEKMKILKRRKEREYHKHRKSIKYQNFQKLYEKSETEAKHNFYEKTIHDLKQSEPGQWYSKLKRLCSYDEKKRNK